MTNIIEIKNLNKNFKENQVLNNINITFESGQIHGIIGRNGSGKTVLIKIICGLINATSGTVTVFDKEVGRGKAFPQDIGFIIEAPGFIPTETGLKNLIYLASIQKKIGKKEIEDSMNLVGLDPYNKKPVSKYSMGMKQRLGIAQAIMENPKLLILDEPMNGLDKSGVDDMRQYIKTFKEQGKTVILISHNSEDISTICDTVCEIDQGTLTKIR